MSCLGVLHCLHHWSYPFSLGKSEPRFGDFDMFEYQGQDPTYALNNTSGEWEPNDPSPTKLKHDTYGMLIYIYLQALFFSTGIGVQVLLISLLTGLLGSNYDLHKGRAQVLFLQARARMLLDQDRRPWVKLTNQVRRLTTTERSQNDKRESEKTSQEGGGKIGPCCEWCAQLLDRALRPLEIIMKPPTRDKSSSDTPFRKDLFHRFVFRFVWAPVQRNSCIAFIMLPLAPVLGLLSLVSVLVFWLVVIILFLVALFLCPIFNVEGLSYAINLSLR